MSMSIHNEEERLSATQPRPESRFVAFLLQKGQQMKSIESINIASAPLSLDGYHELALLGGLRVLLLLLLHSQPASVVPTFDSAAPCRLLPSTHARLVDDAQ